MPSREQLGGGVNSRPLNDTIGETGEGLPDDAVGPEQRTIEDQLDLARDPATEAIARKLREEVGAWRGAGHADGEVSPEDDPTGHA